MGLDDRDPQNRTRLIASSATAAFAALIAAVLAVHLATAVAQVGSRQLDRELNDLTYALVIALAAAAVLYRSRRHRESRRAWLAIGFGMAAWAAGDLWFVIAYAGPGPIPYPSPSDGLYILQYAGLIAGMWIISGQFRSRAALSPALLISILGIATIWSWLVYDEVVEGAAGSAAAVAVTLAYPLLDLFLLISLVLALAARDWRPEPSLLLVGAGFVALALADSVYAVAVANDVYVGRDLGDALWPISAALIAAGSAFRTTAPTPVGPRGERALLRGLVIAAILLAVAILVVDHFSRVDGVTIVLAATTLAACCAQLVVLERDRRRRELELDELASIVDCSGDAMLTSDLEGTVSGWSPGAERLYGFSAADAIGHPLSELTVPRDRVGEIAMVLARVRAGEPVTFETKRVTRSGIAIDVSIHAIPVRDLSGAVVGVTTAARDITDRHRLEAVERREREGRLWRERTKAALAEGRLEFWAQPIADVRTGTVHHHELLLRMKEGGETIGPDRFLPHAERSELIAAIDRWAIDRGSELARHEPVAINLSARSLATPELVGAVERAILAGTPAANFVFEITETAAAENLEAARELVTSLTDLGCGVALDDFGTGYGCFTYLKHLPVTTLKIDAGFIRNLGEDETDARVVRSIIAVAANFGIKTVAEGVESPRALELLRELGVDYVQGYLIGPPGPLAPPTLDEGVSAATTAR